MINSWKIIEYDREDDVSLYNWPLHNQLSNIIDNHTRKSLPNRFSQAWLQLINSYSYRLGFPDASCSIDYTNSLPKRACTLIGYVRILKCYHHYLKSCWTFCYWVIFVGIYAIKYLIIHEFEAESVAKIPYQILVCFIPVE